MIIEYILDFFCLAVLAFLWRITLKNYAALPEIIPVHFDLDGKADRHGSKRMMFFGPVFCSLFFMLILWVSQYPDSVNFPVKITVENEKRQMLIMTVFLRWIVFLVILIFINSQDFLLRYISDPSAKAKFSLFSILTSVFLSVAAVIILAALLK